MPRIQKRLSVAQHLWRIARLFTVLVLHQQQVQVALASLIVAMAVGAAPLSVGLQERVMAVRADKFDHQASNRSSVAS